jgi:zinc/manganese transport system substrate-binding protein
MKLKARKNRRAGRATLRSVAVLLLGAFLHCPAAEQRPLIVSSFLPIYCWTANVAGEAARVENLLPARAEPHDYAFTPGDARRLHAADFVVANGLGLEPWLERWRHGAADGKRKLLVVSELVPELGQSESHDDHDHSGHDHGHGHGHSHKGGHCHGGHGVDPHFWLDPVMARAAVSNIAVGLARLDPSRAASYARNAEGYVAKLHALDADIRNGLAGVTNRAIVTYHNAFPWFAKRYGLDIAGVVEEVPDVNPTPKALARLSQMMRTRGIRAIFVPPNSSSRLARQIAKDLRVELLELDTLESGELTADAYERGMRANLAALKRALH